MWISLLPINDLVSTSWQAFRQDPERTKKGFSNTPGFVILCFFT
jgi:hypothetical protein